MYYSMQFNKIGIFMTFALFRKLNSCFGSELIFLKYAFHFKLKGLMIFKLNGLMIESLKFVRIKTKDAIVEKVKVSIM